VNYYSLATEPEGDPRSAPAGILNKFNRGRERILSQHLDRFKEVAVF